MFALLEAILILSCVWDLTLPAIIVKEVLSLGVGLIDMCLRLVHIPGILTLLTGFIERGPLTTP
jgi:hypothetical protein